MFTWGRNKSFSFSTSKKESEFLAHQNQEEEEEDGDGTSSESSRPSSPESNDGWVSRNEFIDHLKSGKNANKDRRSANDIKDEDDDLCVEDIDVPSDKIKIFNTEGEGEEEGGEEDEIEFIRTSIELLSDIDGADGEIIEPTEEAETDGSLLDASMQVGDFCSHDVKQFGEGMSDEAPNQQSISPTSSPLRITSPDYVVKRKDCPICLFPIVDIERISNCGHEFCKTCISSIRKKLIDKAERKHIRKMKLIQYSNDDDALNSNKNKSKSVEEDDEAGEDGDVEIDICPLCSSTKSALFIQQRWACRVALENDRLKSMEFKVKSDALVSEIKDENGEEEAEMENDPTTEKGVKRFNLKTLSSDNGASSEDRNNQSSSTTIHEQLQSMTEQYECCQEQLKQSKGTEKSYKSVILKQTSYIKSLKKMLPSSPSSSHSSLTKPTSRQLPNEDNMNKIRENNHMDEKEEEDVKELEKVFELVRNLKEKEKEILEKNTNLQNEMSEIVLELKNKEEENKQLITKHDEYIIQTKQTNEEFLTMKNMIQNEKERNLKLLSEIRSLKSLHVLENKKQTKLNETKITELSKNCFELEKQQRIDENNHKKLSNLQSLKIDHFQKENEILKQKYEEIEKNKELEKSLLEKNHCKEIELLKFESNQMIESLQNQVNRFNENSLSSSCLKVDSQEEETIYRRALAHEKERQQVEMKEVQSRQQDKVKGLIATIRSLGSKLEEANNRCARTKEAARGRMETDSARIIWLREQLKQANNDDDDDEEEDKSNSASISDNKPFDGVSYEEVERRMRELNQTHQASLTKLISEHRRELSKEKTLQYKYIDTISKLQKESEKLNKMIKSYQTSSSLTSSSPSSSSSSSSPSSASSSSSSSSSSTSTRSLQRRFKTPDKAARAGGVTDTHRTSSPFSSRSSSMPRSMSTTTIPAAVPSTTTARTTSPVKYSSRSNSMPRSEAPPITNEDNVKKIDPAIEIIPELSGYSVGKVAQMFEAKNRSSTSHWDTVRSQRAFLRKASSSSSTLSNSAVTLGSANGINSTAPSLGSIKSKVTDDCAQAIPTLKSVRGSDQKAQHKYQQRPVAPSKKSSRVPTNSSSVKANSPHQPSRSPSPYPSTSHESHSRSPSPHPSSSRFPSRSSSPYPGSVDLVGERKHTSLRPTSQTLPEDSEKLRTS